MARIDPHADAALRGYVQTIRLFDPGAADTGVVGATGMQFFGALYMKVHEEDPVPHYTDQLLHETSHLHLHAMMGLDHFFTNDRSQRLPGPIRDEPRPIVGVLHAAYVVARTLRSLPRFRDEYGDRAKRDEADLRGRLDSAIHDLDAHVRWTPAGRAFFEALQAMVDDSG